MNFKVFDHVDVLVRSESVAALCDAFSAIMCKYGFDQYALAYDPIAKNQDKPVVLATYDRDWVNYYFDNGYEKIDPVMLRSKLRGSDAAFLWSSLWANLELTPIQRKMFHEAKEYGLTLGLGIPITLASRDNGMISLASSVCSSSELEKIVNENMGELAMLSTYFQQISEKLLSDKRTLLKREILSNREVECLTWAARGKSNVEIGIILGITENTVKTYFETACKKLNVVNRTQACAKAVFDRIIEPFK